MTTISFIIPLYNKASYIGDMLRSLTHQIGHFEREIICINDGSTDGSREVVQSWMTHHPCIRLIDQHNQGPSIALTRGLSESHGAYIRCVDADDMLHPQATEVMLSLLRQSNAHGVVCDRVIAESDDDVSRIWRTWSLYDQTILQPDCAPLYWHSTGEKSLPLILMTRDGLSRVQGCDPRIFIQDYHLSLKMLFMGPCVRTRLPLYCYRKSISDQLSKNKYQEHHDASLAEALMIQDYSRDISYAFKKKSVSRAWHRVARMLYAQISNKAWIHATMQRYWACMRNHDHDQHSLASIYATCALFRCHVPIRLNACYENMLSHQ